jgi:hypothetical protein
MEELVSAVGQNQPGIVRQLASKMSDVNQKTADGVRITYYARNNAEMVSVLHEQGVDVNEPCEADGTTLAYYATQNVGDGSLLRCLHKLGVDLSAPCSNGYTPAFYCCKDQELIRVLHELGVDLNKPVSSKGHTLVYYAVLNADIKILEILHSLASVDLSQSCHPNGATPAYYARKTPDVLKLLRKQGMDLNLPCQLDGTTLMWYTAYCADPGSMSREECSALLKTLHSLGVDILAPCTASGTNAVFQARNDPATLRLFHTLGADLSVPCSPTGFTAAFYAKDKPDTVRCLKELGVDPAKHKQ